MNAIVLDYNEEFITFLEPDLFTIVEENEVGGIRLIDVEYYMRDMAEARELFCIGNKIYISDGENSCLYVINTEVRRDYFKENNVVFTAEDVIVELNYVPLFSQTDLTAKNGFTLSTNAGELNVKVNYNALNYWFGEYYNIGIVQDCLSTEISKISPTGTMTKMELLRFIEEETCNIFVPRYEKDLNNNVIHRYLDFLNPNSTDNNWEVNFEYIPVEQDTFVEENPINDSDDVEDTDDLVTFPPYTQPVEHDPSNITVSIKGDDGEVIEDLSWNAADDLNISNEYDTVVVKLKYNKPVLTATINKNTYTATATSSNDADIDGSVVDVSPLNAGAIEVDETNITTVSESIELHNDIVIPNHTIFEVLDTETDTILYSHQINPVLGDVHEDVLDLGYNTENIEYEIGESDTFNAIAPIFNLDEGGSNGMSRDDLTTIINRWKNLSVNKGDKIPMIVQRVTITGTDSKPCTSRTGATTSTTTNALTLLGGNKNVSTNWWLKPLHGNDNTEGTNKSYEYLKATAYWYAPFTKVKGEMHIETPDTKAEYTHIRTKADNTSPYGAYNTPKIGTVETSEEDPYAIYNAVAMKLKDKIDPKIEIKVDVAKYRDGLFNNYCIHDKVFVKIPGFESLVTAVVSKTSKNFHDISENTVELSNFSVNTKVATHDTFFTGDNLDFKYPKKGTLKISLSDLTNDQKLSKKLVNLVLYDTTGGSSTFKKSYSKTTNTNGEVSLTLSLNPGTYVVEASFGGDVEYTGCTASFDVNVSGKLTTTTTTSSNKTSNSKTTSSKKKVKTYWTKCGISPDKKQIVSIAQPSASNSDMKKHNVNYNTIYKTVFKNKCPYCGKAALRYDDGKKNGCITNHGHKGNKKEVPEGKIRCRNCDTDFDGVTGLEKSSRHTSRLTVVKKPVKSSKTEKAKLISGKLQYGTKTVTVTSKKNSKKTTTHTPVGTVNKKVKEWALKKVGKSKGAAAAKKLAKAVGAITYVGYSGFKRSPATVLSKGGNCCDQTRLFLMACDAVGVSETYTLKYVHVCCKRSGKWAGVGHMFARLVNKKTAKGVYVDCTTNPSWNNHLKNWGSVPGSQKNYPKLPF